MSVVVLVDRDGQVWPESSQLLQRTLQTDRTGARLSSFLIKSLGYVHIHQRRANCVVTLRERCAHPVAVVGTMQWIAEHAIERVLIRLDFGPQAPQRLLDRRTAIAYLGSRADEWAHRLSLYSARPVTLPLARLPYDLASVRQLLCADMEEQVRLGLLKRVLGDHFFVATSHPLTRQFVVDQAGPAWTQYHSTIGPLRSGTSLTSIRDKSYGRWAERAYSDAIATGEPVAHDVEATIGAGTPTPMALSYRRVLLPYTRSGESRLLVASRLSA